MIEYRRYAPHDLLGRGARDDKRDWKNHKKQNKMQESNKDPEIWRKFFENFSFFLEIQTQKSKKQNKMQKTNKDPEFEGSFFEIFSFFLEI